jgi:hypothetical protein
MSVLTSSHLNEGHSYDMMIANTFYEKVAKQYFVKTVTNQNLIQDEIKSRLNPGNACYHSVQNRLSSCLLSTNVKSRIHKTVTLPAVLYGCETWSDIKRRT